MEWLWEHLWPTHSHGVKLVTVTAAVTRGIGFGLATLVASVHPWAGRHIQVTPASHQPECGTLCVGGLEESRGRAGPLGDTVGDHRVHPYQEQSRYLGETGLVDKRGSPWHARS